MKGKPDIGRGTCNVIVGEHRRKRAYLMYSVLMSCAETMPGTASTIWNTESRQSGGFPAKTGGDVGKN